HPPVYNEQSDGRKKDMRRRAESDLKNPDRSDASSQSLAIRKKAGKEEYRNMVLCRNVLVGRIRIKRKGNKGGGSE
ncbi:MAG: hypothetical protein J6C33_11920, partial [Lachnospiraceae bacterium]|nr:hypothetical protein [Lachnospiraceae bacterium]